jgi:hypothetical protein
MSAMAHGTNHYPSMLPGWVILYQAFSIFLYVPISTPVVCVPFFHHSTLFIHCAVIRVTIDVNISAYIGINQNINLDR